MVKKMICNLLVLPIYFIIFMILSMFNIYLFEGPWYISIPIIVIFPLIGTILAIINYNKRINYPALFMMIFFVIMGLICYYKTYTLNPNYDTLTYFVFFIIFAIYRSIFNVLKDFLNGFFKFILTIFKPTTQFYINNIFNIIVPI